MADTIAMTSAVSRRELLAKAKELQTPRSFATGALVGLTLYQHGEKDEAVLQMLREGIRFCEFCKRDLEAYQSGATYSFKPEKGPRYYSPSEVLPNQPSQADVSDLKSKIESTIDRLNAILADKPVPEQKIKECHRFVEELLRPYRTQAAVSLGEFKYGPTLRR